MRPTYDIWAEGQRITNQIKQRLLSLHVTDEAGFSSDTVEFTLDDSEGILELPRTGAKIQVSLGYEETGLVSMGHYVVDELTLEGPPHVLKIKGHAADLKQSLKAPTTHSWRETTIGSLVKAIASKHGYQAAIPQELAQIPIPHLDQTAESDLHLLTRLSDHYGALAKPAGGHLVFAPQGQARSVSGKVLASTTIKLQDVTHWHVTWQERDNYGAVAAAWHDLDEGATNEEISGEGQTIHTLKTTYPTSEDAKAAATAQHKKLTRQQTTLNITLIGRPELCAETPLTLVGFRAGIRSSWIINRAEHVLDQSGYHTRIEASLPLKEGTDETSQPQPPP